MPELGPSRRPQAEEMENWFEAGSSGFFFSAVSRDFASSFASCLLFMDQCKQPSLTDWTGAGLPLKAEGFFSPTLSKVVLANLFGSEW